MTTDQIRPFSISVPQADLDDLATRLARTRWPDAETVSDWSQGAPLAKVRELAEYWRDHYDWRRCEAALNAWPQFTTEIDGLSIWFLHIRSRHENARPLLLTHGWPGSVLEFMKVIGPLTDPEAHGGTAEDAYHLVIPALPGFGFSGKPEATGWGIKRIAAAWVTLMERLGYARWLAYGGDWGSVVTHAIGALAPAACVGIHVTMLLPDAQWMAAPPESAIERRGVERLANYQANDSGYYKQQSTRPQTLGYGLADSPVALAAWIYEKYWSWIDHGGDPAEILSFDEMLDNISLYWLTNSGASSTRIYWEYEAAPFNDPVTLPSGSSIFPQEILYTSRERAGGRLQNLVYWNELDKGGHFAAWEQPELFVNELRACFRAMWR